MTIYINAGPLAESPVIASMCFSSAMIVRPTESNMNLASSRCSRDALRPAEMPVIPLLSRHGVFGIARMIGTGAASCFSIKAVLTDAATDMSNCDGPMASFISPSTAGTVCGFTLNSTMSADSTASLFDNVPARREPLAHMVEAALMSGGDDQVSGLDDAGVEQPLDQSFAQLSRAQNRYSFILQHLYIPQLRCMTRMIAAALKPCQQASIQPRSAFANKERLAAPG